MLPDFYECVFILFDLIFLLICLQLLRYFDSMRVFAAGVVKLVDTLDLGSSAARRGGSSPFSRTIIIFLFFISLLPIYGDQNRFSVSDVIEAHPTPNYLDLQGKFILTDFETKEKVRGDYKQVVETDFIIKLFTVSEPKAFQGDSHEIEYRFIDQTISHRATHRFPSRYDHCILGSNISFLDLAWFNIQDFNILSASYVMRGVKNYWEIKIEPKNKALKVKYNFNQALVFLNSKRLWPERLGYVPLGTTYYKMIVFKGYKSFESYSVPTVVEVSYLDSYKNRLSKFSLAFKSLKIPGKKWYQIF